MTGFLIGAAAIVAAALLLMLRPFYWQRARATASHRDLNSAIYRDQMAELERDRAAGTLAEEDYRQAHAELQRRVLEDSQGEETAPTLKAPKKTVIALAVLLPIAGIGLYLWLGHPEGLNPMLEKRISAQDIDRMVSTLADKMEKDPNNLQGWGMLARSYRALGRVDDAAKAFEHAAGLPGADAQLIAEYADIVAMQAGGNLAGKPQALIDKALKLDPNNPQALWLAGTAAFNDGRYDKAATTWTKLQGLLPPESEDAKQIAGAIAEARAKGGKPAAAATPAKDASGKAASKTGATQGAVSGRVELAAAVRDRAASGDTVMIVAREAGGPRMPIAVLRLKVADLPHDFVLDDSLAMMPDRKISGVKNVEIEARVSKSGDAMPKPGDLHSNVQQTQPGKSGLKLLIDQVRQ